MISEDLVFNIDYMQHADGACTIEKMGYNYRVNLKSLSTSYRPDRFEASKHFYLEMKKKLQELGYGKETMLRLDRMFFVYLRMCISQERPDVSHNSRLKSCDNIRVICNDKVVQQIVKEYPAKLLGIKQRIFLYLIYHKMNKMLCCMAEKGVV